MMFIGSAALHSRALFHAHIFKRAMVCIKPFPVEPGLQGVQLERESTEDWKNIQRLGKWTLEERKRRTRRSESVLWF